jgi:P-type E1-E2 ATPase
MEAWMLILEIPGDETLHLEHLLLDYNGTLAVDGSPLPGVAERIEELGTRVAIRVVTADTFGRAAAQLSGLPVEVVVLPAADQPAAKGALVEDLGAARVAAIGNGRNDHLMLAAAALGVAVIQEEGASSRTLRAADVVVPSITAALDLLRNPMRLAATLRL